MEHLKSDFNPIILAILEYYNCGLFDLTMFKVWDIKDLHIRLQRYRDYKIRASDEFLFVVDIDIQILAQAKCFRQQNI